MGRMRFDMLMGDSTKEQTKVQGFDTLEPLLAGVGNIR